ncbi:hypothetical protein BE08_25890 [Sorangium cellulosum]|uniref:Uncharacterized protein n=1 Tax=Sorangium cellulosum TaxID=56 RepID=A0A150PQE8_SORCE|nr:hypothetical protein BE08_25890 [Sorangium cellulosum]
MSKPTLTEADLTVIAEGTPALDPFPTRPWDRERLWAAVLDLHLKAKTRADREAFQQALGAIQVLDTLIRLYVRDDG